MGFYMTVYLIHCIIRTFWIKHNNMSLNSNLKLSVQQKDIILKRLSKCIMIQNKDYILRRLYIYINKSFSFDSFSIIIVIIYIYFFSSSSCTSFSLSLQYNAHGTEYEAGEYETHLQFSIFGRVRKRWSGSEMSS